MRTNISKVHLLSREPKINSCKYLLFLARDKSVRYQAGKYEVRSKLKKKLQERGEKLF
ncbi:unnamed protein product [Tenebrio molitor]|nr:unnamed protein product [Tenebrio molitor]